MDLGVKKVDYLVSTLKAATGVIPCVGSILSEIIGITIPNQRIDRVEKYLKILSDKLEKNSFDFKAKIKENKNLLLLFEESIIYSAQTTSEKKYEWYSEFIISSIKENGVENIQQQRMLKILSELNENEVIILIFYSLNPTIGMKNKFIEEHSDIIIRGSNEMGLPAMKYVDNEFHDLYKKNLEQYGLIKRRPEVHRELNTIIIDKASGEIKQSIPQITMLGKLVVNFIGADNY